MSELLRTHIQKRISISDKELDRCLSFFTVKKIRRRQFFLQEGEVCKNIAYVTKGCMRAYTVDVQGEEHVIQFAVEDWWISDLHSYLTGTPSVYSIDALEDSELLLLEKQTRERLFVAVPAFERLFRLLMEANYIATHRRIHNALSTSAAERYLDFLKTYPNLAQRFPQKDIASYLGITPQSLSRIRRGITEKGKLPTSLP